MASADGPRGRGSPTDVRSPPVLQRFVILSASRCGSNLLVSLLNSHPRIQCEGEVLHDYDLQQIHWAFADRETTPEDFEVREHDPVRFLETRVFAPRSTEILASGFKLFYWQAGRDKWRVVWPYLRGARDLKVIQLRRRNVLRRVLSNQVAQMTDKWFALDEKQVHRDVRVNLDAEECRAEFTANQRFETDKAAYFSTHPFLEVFYEDLTADFHGETARIQEFLGVPEQQLETPLKKQLSQPLPKVIENYAELKRAFAGTEWESCFDE